MNPHSIDTTFLSKSTNMDNNKNVQLHVFRHTDLSTHDIQLWGAAIPLLLSITPIQALLLEEPSVFPLYIRKLQTMSFLMLATS